MRDMYPIANSGILPNNHRTLHSHTPSKRYPIFNHQNARALRLGCYVHIHPHSDGFPIHAPPSMMTPFPPDFKMVPGPM